MCPSCIPAAPILAAALSGGGLIFALRFLILRRLKGLRFH